jgi:hypothetical protein
VTRLEASGLEYVRSVYAATGGNCRVVCPKVSRFDLHPFRYQTDGID